MSSEDTHSDTVCQATLITVNNKDIEDMSNFDSALWFLIFQDFATVAKSINNMNSLEQLSSQAVADSNVIQSLWLPFFES